MMRNQRNFIGLIICLVISGCATPGSDAQLCRDKKYDELHKRYYPLSGERVCAVRSNYQTESKPKMHCYKVFNGFTCR